MADKTIVDKAAFVVGFGIAAVSDVAAAVKTALVGGAVSSEEVSKAEPVHMTAPEHAIERAPARKGTAKKSTKQTFTKKAAVKKTPAKKTATKKAVAKKAAKKSAKVPSGS